jgi:hypothetical protein
VISFTAINNVKTDQNLQLGPVGEIERNRPTSSEKVGQRGPGKMKTIFWLFLANDRASGPGNRTIELGRFPKV